ncbi:unnamed protein product [Brassica napus]|uniref:(rape) hypothetical protein n=1 Tax=Brassica napus TaxID=3708 RepID=A0A816KAJ0_BRANA|nr:unnamed protein product [Brassica napus]
MYFNNSKPKHSVYKAFRPIIFGGCLTLSPLGDNQCPLYIEQQFSKDDIGYPIRFSNWGSGARFVPESENLNIEMVIPITTCVQSSTYWWVTATEGSKWLFISAGPKPDPGEASSKSFFQIKKVGDFTNGYKIMFCSKDNNCINVGIVVDEYGVQRLALCTMPFPITLVKADGTQGRSYIIE